MSNSNKEKKPKIRFPEFTGDWELYRLGDITESYSGDRKSVV